MKEKIKNFIENMTPGAKIKYIAVTALVLAIAASIAVFAAVNSSKPSDSIISTDSATIEFDEEIVLDFGDGEDDTDAASKSEIVTDESEPAEESKETEKATESAKETEKETAKATEKEETEPATPSEDTEKNEPKPVVVPETQTPQTQPAVTQKPVTQKPVTQAPQTQAPQTQAPQTQAPVTQAPVTQAPVTQAPVTQAPETQKPSTEAPATKPTVNEPEEEKNYGSWVVKQKKYYYEDPIYIVRQAGTEYAFGASRENILTSRPGNVIIMSVENKSDEAYTITINGKYLDANGNVLKTESQTFEGFAANWSNYFVFAPGIEFDKFTFDFSSKKYTDTTYVQYMKIFDQCSIGPAKAMTDDSGVEIWPTSAEEMEKLHAEVRVGAGIKMRYTGPGNIDYWGKLIFFDKNGDLAYIRSAGHGNITHDPSISDDNIGGLGRPLFFTGIPYEEVDSYKLPDNLTSITGVYAITEFKINAR